MENELKVGIVIKIDEDLNLKLQQHILDLKRSGVKTTKAELAAKLIKIGLLQEQKLLDHE